MYNKLFLLVLTLLLSFSAQAAKKSTPNLNQTSWILTSLNDQAALPEAVVTLDFMDGKLTGTDGCNRYHSSYTLEGKKLTINKNMASTMMMCPENFMQQAATYNKALIATAGFKVDDQQLSLLNAQGKELAIFSKQKQGLLNTEWRVNSINNGRQAVVRLIDGAKLSLQFSADGNISGSAGCNNFTGSYRIFEKKLKISSVVATRRFCEHPLGIMEQEIQFLKALESVATFQIEGNLIGLRTAEDALAVLLVPIK